MDFKGMRDVGGETRERQMHDGKLVGGHEARAVGRKDGRKGIVRRATFDDLDAIMDINDDVYDGLDYMPTLFYTFMQSKLHAIYVYEEDGKLISLANIRFHPDCDDLVAVTSGRVRPSHEGRGLALVPTSQRFVQLLKDHPTKTRYVLDRLFPEHMSAKMQDLKANYQWNVLMYVLADRQWLSRFTRIRQMAFDANRPFSLSYTCGTEWLERSDQLIRFISKYVKDLFPCGTVWIPTPVDRSGLRHMLASTNVFISMNSMSTTETSFSSPPLPSTNRGLPGTTYMYKGYDGDIVGLSYSSSCPCKYGMRVDIFFYGDCDKVFLSHIYSHLQHYNNITSNDVRIVVILHFPRTIGIKIVNDLLNVEIGEKFHGNDSTQAIQYIDDFPKAKL